MDAEGRFHLDADGVLVEDAARLDGYLRGRAEVADLERIRDERAEARRRLAELGAAGGGEQ